MCAIERIHYMDNLRALAMLTGVLFHASLAYSPVMHNVWPAADTSQSIAVDAIAWFLHMFRMPLFFSVTGFFTALLIARRGMVGLFRNRCTRVLLPLMLFLPLVLASMGWLTERAAMNAAHTSPALAWVRAFLDQHGAMPPAFGWAHLWFLFYLMLFTVIVWVMSALELGRIGDTIAALPPGALAVVMPLMLTPALAFVGTPWPAPEFFIPSLWALAFFGAYFALGFQLYRHSNWIDRLRSHSSSLLIGAIAAWAVLFWITNGLAAVRPSPLQHFLHATLEACVGTWMTLWCLLAAQRWLSSASPSMRWLSDASYWVYLVHLPLLLAVQYELLDLQMGLVAKFFISTVFTLTMSFVSYQLAVRHSIVGKMLNGSAQRAGGAAKQN